MATKALLSASVVGAGFFTTLTLWNSYIRIEPMVWIEPKKGGEVEVFLKGVAGNVHTTNIRHEGVECLKRQGFGIRIRSSPNVLLGQGGSQEPVLTFYSSPSEMYSDVVLSKFVGACLECKARTKIEYKDELGRKKEKKLSWV
jgi:hypothetical protein